ncbi:MAG TPA: PadR family transcriptional regulator [Bryobacteraceae bacterium]|nr:PadR family transcriptional regulator [Bryobacteraceae bacterium]
MGRRDEKALGVLQGTLDLMILKTLSSGSMHGYDILEGIEARSGDVLHVEEGALYPALHRRELRGLLSSEWGVSVNNRRAKFYRLTPSGRKHLNEECRTFEKLSSAVLRVLTSEA